jgi:tripartite-type tricarboxylate transporter receptor subunit TctC
MAPIGSSASLVREGKLRGLGVSTLKRSPALPDIPTIAESGLPGFEWDAWRSLLAPVKTSRAITERWNQEVRRAGAAPDIVKRYRTTVIRASASHSRCHYGLAGSIQFLRYSVGHRQRSCTAA